MSRDQRLSFFGKDPRSTVFARDGRILRSGIDVALTRALLADPGVRHLMEQGDLVATRLIEDAPDGPLLEHERIAPFTFPGEWSFTMLQDAALTTLRVQDALAARGYGLKDAHAYNVSFDGSRPVFIDFGSIDRADPRYRTWRAGEEYRDAFLRILRIWSRTHRTTALAFLNSVWARPDDEALIRRGRFGHRLGSRVRRAYGKALIATAMTPQERALALQKMAFSGAKRTLAQGLLAGLDATQSLTGHPFAPARLRRATESIVPPVGATAWASYQQDLSLHRELTPRFRRIVDLVAGLQARDAFEVAGNQGALSQALLEAGAVQHVVCSDYDEHAIDALYRRIRASRRRDLTPLVRNVMMPDPIRGESTRELKADVVLALALTHHLLLTQGYMLDAVIERIAAHSRRHLLIEFMPRGLWDGTSGPPVPSWYTARWFAEGLQRYGRVQLQEQLEENRVLFVVELGVGTGGAR